MRTSVRQPGDRVRRVTDPATIEEARRQLLGAWELVAFEDRPTESDAWTQTYGPDPAGLISYDASGTVATIVPAAGSIDELVAYYGAFRVTEARVDGDVLRGVVEHHMEIAFPAWLFDEEPPRPFELSDGRLVLGDQRTARRILRRR
jgi:hypothetical protein